MDPHHRRAGSVDHLLGRTSRMDDDGLPSNVNHADDSRAAFHPPGPPAPERQGPEAYAQPKHRAARCARPLGDVIASYAHSGAAADIAEIRARTSADADRVPDAGTNMATDNPVFDTELRALAATGVDRSPFGSRSGAEAEAAAFAVPAAVGHGPVGAAGSGDAGVDATPVTTSAMDQLLALGAEVEWARHRCINLLSAICAAHQSELAAAGDRLLAAERGITDRGAVIARLKADLAAAEQRQNVLHSKIDSMMNCNTEALQIARAPATEEG